MKVFRITGLYILVSCLWIVLSDRLLTFWGGSGELLTSLQTVKGFFFIAVTAFMLHILITRYIAALTQSEAKFRESCEALSAYNEELIAAEEQLRKQFEALMASQARADRQNEYLNALHQTTLGLIQDLDFDRLLTDIVQKAVALGHAQHGYLYLFNKETQELESKVSVGSKFPQAGYRHHKGKGVVGKVWETGAPVVVKDYSCWEDRLQEPQFEVLKISAGFPLLINGEVAGVLGVDYTEEYPLEEELMQLLASFAEMASIAFRNAQTHQALRESQTKARVLIESLPDLVLRISREGRLIDYELGRETTPRFDLRGKLGQALPALLPHDLVELLRLHVERAIATKATQLFEYKIEDDQHPLYRETRVVPIDDSEVMCVVRDITDQKDMEQLLRYMSLHDPATGLFDRAYFHAQLVHMEAEPNFPVGIIVCDIDGLKLINDSFGQDAGDQILIQLAAALSGCARPQDVVARIGGDEFAILMPAAEACCLDKVNRCITEAIQDFNEDRPEIPISISRGSSLAQDSQEPLVAVLKRAEDNMYREKLHQGQSVRSAIVNTLAKAMEARDFITDGHADRLQDIVELVARKAGVPEGELSDYRLLARFHDIGKVGIPDHILFKPGRLTPEEFETMKRHCEIGYRIALASPELAPIADWILKHQEWWNGEGYPLGIKGEEIPLVCRILSLADAYDAMTNDRPYRKAMSHEEALKEIRRCAGRQFDPVLAELFAAVIQEQKPPA